MPAASEEQRTLRVVVADDNPVVRAGLTVLLQGRAEIEVVAEAADGRAAYDEAVRHRPDVILLDVRMPGVDGISALPYLVRIAPVMMLTYSRENEIVREALRLGASGYLVHGEFTADEFVAAVRDIRGGRAHFTPSAASALLSQFREEAPPDHHPPGPPPAQPPTRQGESPWPPPHQGPVSVPSQLSETVSSRPQHVTSSGAGYGHGHVPGSQSQSSASARERFGLSGREVEVMELIASGVTNKQIAATCFISEKTVKNHINRIFTKLDSSSRSEAIAVWLGTSRREEGRRD
ncbi:response regulator transcription factor [Streptomyces sp. NPDC005438]|uniref:response regulator transcription factor n=1 Tax=Streptomyces sp. NPDC005438 TaxID=3156880 RepID=UPI0033A27E5F